MEEYKKSLEEKNKNQEDDNAKNNQTAHHSQSIEETKQLIDAVRMQLEEEQEKMNEMKSKIYKENDFKVSKFAVYEGPNFYMDSKALVFNIFIAPIGDSVDFFKEEISKVFPAFADNKAKYTIDLFADALIQILKMDINLYINTYEIGYDDEEYVVAVEYLDKDIAQDCVYLVSDWFYAMSNNEDFDILSEWKNLQQEFDVTFYGGPTLYSLIEGGLKRDIPVTYLFEENEFQWGYGCKQLRGRSTTFHTDSIKDTEFTMYKDMVGDFLEMCGFPTPKTINTFTVEEAVLASVEIGFPCVVKPVAGHKGQGVTTNIQNEQQIREAFQNILTIYADNEIQFDGALVQTQIFGTDHRLLSVEGKFAAALERVPAYVVGDGKLTIKELIDIENAKIIRLDNARSPLCKIQIDDDLLKYLELQNYSLQTIPEPNQHIVLRRVANISAGGVSINVTENIHPDNIQLVEDIASYFQVKCLGIDVLAKDISKSWKDSDFGIIEINAGPGVFMHLAPAYGGAIDIPELILQSHFKDFSKARIPIISANLLSKELSEKIYSTIHETNPHIFYTSLLSEGVFFNNRFFHNNPDHISNQKIILRHPKTQIALFTHNKDQIYDFGLLYKGADMVILNNAAYAEESVLLKQLLPDSPLIEVIENTVNLIINDNVIETIHFIDDTEKEETILQFAKKYIPALINKYDIHN
jgi:cyanophycin synthetase